MLGSVGGNDFNNLVKVGRPLSRNHQWLKRKRARGSSRGANPRPGSGRTTTRTMAVGLRDDLFKETGRRTLNKSQDVEKILIGIPLRSLSLRLLFQATVPPTGRVIHIFGPTESMKSALTFKDIAVGIAEEEPGKGRQPRRLDQGCPVCQAANPYRRRRRSGFAALPGKAG
jgi:hypothetical protein